jgi:hypothetical protein
MLRRGSAAAVVAVLSMLMAVAVGQALFNRPAFVDHITVVNETPYDFGVSTSGPDGAGTVGLGAVRQHCDTRFEGVVDQGATWEFHLVTQSVDAGTVAVSRSDLRDGGWTVRIAAAIGAQLQAARVDLPPAKSC